jgi:hypothetical protein
MKKYNPQAFINALGQKAPNKQLVCPYCQGTQFTSTEDFASILIGKDLGGISLGPSIPSGMIICQKCGHIDFFALGALGLLETKEENDG